MSHLLSITLRRLGAIAIAVMLVACASGPPRPDVDFKPDYDFSRVKKLAFYKDSGMVSGSNPILLSDMQRERINSALQLALSNKGYEMVADASQADLLISWHLATQDKTDVRTYESPGMGVGYVSFGRYNRYSLYHCWACAPTQTEVSVRNYTQGTFIVDMIDPGLEKSVWRGVTQSRLQGDHKKDQGMYNATVTAIFDSFPPP